MTKGLIRRATTALLALGIAFAPPMASLSDTGTAYAAEWTGRVNATSLNVRSGPGTSYSSVARLSNNAQVTVVSQETGSDGYVWYKIRFSGGEGYARSDYIREPVAYTTDANFENYLNQQGFPESYKDGLRELHAQYPNWIFTAQHTGLSWNEVIPEESKIGRNLVHKDSISSWKSIEEGAYDWNTSTWAPLDGNAWNPASREIIMYYMDPRNFLTDPYIFQFELQSYNESTQTRDGVVKLVEGTFLAGDAIVPIEGSLVSGGTPVAVTDNTQNQDNNSATAPSSPGNTQTSPDGAVVVGSGPSSNSGYVNSGPGAVGNQTSETTSPGVIISPQAGGSPTASSETQADASAQGTSTDPSATNAAGGTENAQPTMKAVPYVDIIMEAARRSGVSPYVLASMIIQEQGKDGGSDLISGSSTSYPGIYNYFNIGAYAHDGMGVVEAGLNYASQSSQTGTDLRPWNNIEKAIIGGAVAYGANYVNQGQDTFYLKKFNVQGDNKYQHQYMTNVPAAASEGEKIAAAYNSDIKSTALVFKIPVYTDMPETACAAPTIDGSPNNKLLNLTIDGYTLTPTFNKDTTEYSLIVDGSVSSVNIIAQAIDSEATVSGSGTVDLVTGVNTIKITVTAGNGSTRDYTINISKSGDSTGTVAGTPSGNTPSENTGAGPGVTSPTGESPVSPAGPDSQTQASQPSIIIIG